MASFLFRPVILFCPIAPFSFSTDQLLLALHVLSRYRIRTATTSTPNPDHTRRQ